MINPLLDMLVKDNILKRLKNTEEPEDVQGAPEGPATSGQAGSGKWWLQREPRSAGAPQGPAHTPLCRGRFSVAVGSASATVLAGAGRSPGWAQTAAALTQVWPLPQLGQL